MQIKNIASQFRMINERDDLTAKQKGLRTAIQKWVVRINGEIIEPLHPYSANIDIFTRIFEGGETLTFYYVQSEVRSITNKDGFNLLATEYETNIADFPVFVNNKEVTISTPIIMINKKTYIPIKEFANLLEVKVDWEQEMQTKDFNENVAFDLSEAYRIARVINFPVIINDKELIISNPIVSINNHIYVPIDDLAEQLGFKVSFNEEKGQLEITTK